MKFISTSESNGYIIKPDISFNPKFINNLSIEDEDTILLDYSITSTEKTNTIIDSAIDMLISVEKTQKKITAILFFSERLCVPKIRTIDGMLVFKIKFSSEELIEFNKRIQEMMQ